MRICSATIPQTKLLNLKPRCFTAARSRSKRNFPGISWCLIGCQVPESRISSTDPKHGNHLSWYLAEPTHSRASNGMNYIHGSIAEKSVKLIAVLFGAEVEEAVECTISSQKSIHAHRVMTSSKSRHGWRRGSHIQFGLSGAADSL